MNLYVCDFTQSDNQSHWAAVTGSTIKNTLSRPNKPKTKLRRLHPASCRAWAADKVQPALTPPCPELCEALLCGFSLARPPSTLVLSARCCFCRRWSLPQQPRVSSCAVIIYHTCDTTSCLAHKIRFISRLHRSDVFCSLMYSDSTVCHLYSDLFYLLSR